MCVSMYGLQIKRLGTISWPEHQPIMSTSTPQVKAPAVSPAEKAVEMFPD